MPCSSEVAGQAARTKAALLVCQKYFPDYMKRTPRAGIAGALADLALEHALSICLLVETGVHNGSAMALGRPTIEAQAQSLWILLCASEKMVNQIRTRKRRFPGIEFMLKEIDKVERADGDHLHTIGYIDTFHELTHGGMVQALNRIDSNGEIGAKFKDESICALLQAIASWMWLLARVLSRFDAKEEDPVMRLQNLSGDFFMAFFNPPLTYQGEEDEWNN